ncbi:MAG: type II restriction endonuclease [Erysipelotrichales bacterium]|nr:type II restriction endonuclease [Erysipelotrichales bacterium]
MATRDFTQWLATFTDSVATWDYYTDFEKVFNNVEQIRVELNILNSLIGSQNIEEDFKNLVNKYPEVLKCIPILLAKREKEIIVKDLDKDYYFNFSKANYTVDEYALFMENTGLFNLIQNHVINNLFDYVTGIEVGLDSNARKNRTGHVMEDLVEEFIKKAGFIYNVTYFKEMYKSAIEKKWNIDLSNISNDGKSEKRFDFVIKTDTCIYGIEVNFYSGGGSKLNETARSYKTLALESKTISGFEFMWITDGTGWNSAKNNLEETFDILETIYNINDLKNEIMKGF